jgi:chorismate mutase
MTVGAKGTKFHHFFSSERRPKLIAGPCGVESPEQIMRIASALRMSGTEVLRGGIWKPRTRPGSFQGIGSDGLSWLKTAGLENGMLVTTEVADPMHVEEALSAGIDMLWIGARTTVNPFLVQRIADALRGVKIPVLIKNPISPDVELWTGAIERMSNAGLDEIGVVHRGFSSYEQTHYRNAPNWPIPLEIKRRFPSMPMFCDPSHIAGNASLVSAVSQISMDLNFDGLMVEVHDRPDEALSDKQQQLTPIAFAEMLNQLVVRSENLDDVLSLTQLTSLRTRIDEIDHQLLVHLAKRMELAREIGWIKKENKVTVYQLERWSEILRTRPAVAEQLNLSREFIMKLFEIIHEESIHQQTSLMNHASLTEGKTKD